MPAPTNLARTQPWEHVPVEVADMRLESRNRARAREGGSLHSTGAHLGNGHDESSRAVETTGGEGQKGIGGQAAVRTVGTDLGAAPAAEAFEIPAQGMRSAGRAASAETNCAPRLAELRPTNNSKCGGSGSTVNDVPRWRHVNRTRDRGGTGVRALRLDRPAVPGSRPG
jgi:hypothetical protein